MNARQRRKLTRAMQRKSVAMSLHSEVEGFTDACLLRASGRDFRWIMQASRKHCHSREGRHRLRQIERLQDASPRLQRLRAIGVGERFKESIESATEAFRALGDAAKGVGEAIRDVAQNLTYDCSVCGGTFKFDPEWSAKDVDAEYAEAFPEECESGEALVTVCDDCYKILIIEHTP